MTIIAGIGPARLAENLLMLLGLPREAPAIARSLCGEPGCDQVMLKFPSGHFLFMGIGSLAGFAVLVREGANLGVVAHQMAQLVDAVGHVLTPQLRDDLRRRNLMSGGAGR